MKYEIEDVKNVDVAGLDRRKSPYQQMIDDVKSQGQYYTYPETCRMLGVTRPTLVKAIKGTKVPSKIVRWGKRHVWFFTPADVREASDLLGGVRIKWE